MGIQRIQTSYCCRMEVAPFKLVFIFEAPSQPCLPASFSPPRALSSTPLNASNARAPPPSASCCALFFLRSFAPGRFLFLPAPPHSIARRYIYVSLLMKTHKTSETNCELKKKHTHTHTRTENTTIGQNGRMERTNETDGSNEPTITSTMQRNEAKRNGTGRSETSPTR